MLTDDPDDASCSRPGHRSDERAELGPGLDDTGTNWFMRVPMADKGIGYALARDQVRLALFGGAAEVKIGRFEIERRLGGGGMGEVFLARDPELRRRVAVKLLRPGSGSVLMRERTRREAQALAQINHPNVIDVYEVGEHDGWPFVAMEYVEGRTLRTWLEKERPGWREIVEVYVEAGRGLLAAHRAGLVHRDFKPDNVLISDQDDERRVRVLDFGLARLTGLEDLQLQNTADDREHQALTRSGMVLGTLAYMPPEQLRGDIADSVSDQFSFCVALHHALWGKEPFTGLGIQQRLSAIQRGPEAPPARRGLPRRLWKIVARGLACEPAERWPSMDELLPALELVLARRAAWPALTAAGLAVGLGVGVAYERAMLEDPCQHIELRSSDLWTSERAEQARARFEASGLTFAESSFATVDTALERWSKAWSEQRIGVCRSGEERGRRAGCLDRIHAQIMPLFEAMVAADPRTVTHAVESLQDLPSLRSCDHDEAMLLALAPVPEGMDDELAQHREALAAARALVITGHLREADAAYTALERDAADFAYPPFQAELATARARLLLSLSEPSVSLPRLEHAAKQAERARHDRIAAHVWTVLAHWGVNRPTGQHEDSEDWLERAEISVERVGSPPGLAAPLHCIRGVLLGHDESQREAARAAITRGLDLLALLAAGEQEWMGIEAAATRQWRPVCLADLAHLYTGSEAIDHSTRALAEAEALYGRDHPKVADYGFALARLLLDSGSPGDREDGVDLLEHAASVWFAAHDDSVLQVGDAYISLATTAIESGELDKAVNHAEEARRVYSRVLPPDDYQHAQPLLVEAAIADQSRDFATALDRYDRARTYLADQPNLKSTVAEIDLARGHCLFALGRLDEAQASFENARTSDGSNLEVELGIAALVLRRGDLARASALLEGLGPSGSATLALRRAVLVALVGMRAGQRTTACSAIAAADGTALDPAQTGEIEQLLTNVETSEAERRCLGWSKKDASPQQGMINDHVLHRRQ